MFLLWKYLAASSAMLQVDTSCWRMPLHGHIMTEWQSCRSTPGIRGHEVMKMCCLHQNGHSSTDFFGVRPPSTKVSSPTKIHHFPTQKFTRSQKNQGLMVPRKATWWASFANCAKNCLTYLYGDLKTKLTTVKIRMKWFRLAIFPMPLHTQID